MKVEEADRGRQCVAALLQVIADRYGTHAAASAVSEAEQIARQSEPEEINTPRDAWRKASHMLADRLMGSR